MTTSIILRAISISISYHATLPSVVLSQSARLGELGRRRFPILRRVRRAELPARRHLLVPAARADRRHRASVHEFLPERLYGRLVAAPELAPLVRVEVNQVELGRHRARDLQQALGVLVRVVYASQEDVLEEHVPLVPPRALPREVLAQRPEEPLQVVLAVDGHDPRPNLIRGGVQRHRQRSGRLLQVPLNLRHQAGGGHCDFVSRKCQASRVRQHVHRGQHSVHVVQRLAHAHEHHVGGFFSLAYVGAAPSARQAPRVHHLLDDLRGGEVLPQPHLGGEAELAVHRAPQLRRDAHRGASVGTGVGRDDHRLDDASAVFQAVQHLPRAVRRRLDGFHLQVALDRGDRPERVPELPRHVLHGLEVLHELASAVHPREQLRGALRAFADAHQPRFQLFEAHPFQGGEMRVHDGPRARCRGRRVHLERGI
mmetsp:Transcript_12434/g.52067  ORF Transcript_12434/g.52067 Transcript_12434/m.52067 type:complete len:427 (-) Transcript_12434:1351-2631(-)